MKNSDITVTNSWKVVFDVHGRDAEFPVKPVLNRFSVNHQKPVTCIIENKMYKNIQLEKCLKKKFDMELNESILPLLTKSKTNNKEQSMNAFKVCSSIDTQLPFIIGLRQRLLRAIFFN